MILQRHQLVFIEESANFSIQSCHQDLKLAASLVTSWLKRGLPLVYVRQESLKNTIRLGLPLLWEKQKYHIALQVDKSHIREYQNLPQLTQLQDFFLQSYGIENLHLMLEPLANRYPEFSEFNGLFIYGSFLFHYLSGEPFVNNDSDLDILIHYPQCSINALEELLSILTKKFRRDIDGEVRFDGLGDIAIKELLDTSALKLLCKKQDSVLLITRRELYEHQPTLS